MRLMLRRRAHSAVGWIVKITKKLLVSADMMIFGGLVMFGVGMWMWKPWLSLVACGVILMIFGLINQGTSK